MMPKTKLQAVTISGKAQAALAAGQSVFLWNGTDGLQAVRGSFKTAAEGRLAADKFRDRFKAQGYYKTAYGDRIRPEDVELYLVSKDEARGSGMAWPREG